MALMKIALAGAFLLITGSHAAPLGETDDTICAEHSGDGKFKDCRAAKCAFDRATKICSVATAKPQQGGNKPAPAEGGNVPQTDNSTCAEHSGNGKLSKCREAKCKWVQATKTCSAAAAKPQQGGNKPQQGGDAVDCRSLSGNGKFSKCRAAKCKWVQATKTCSAANAKPQQGGAEDDCSALSGNGKYKDCKAARCHFDQATKTCSAAAAMPQQGGNKPQQGGNKPAPAEGGNVTETPPQTDGITCAEHSGNGKFKHCKAARCHFDQATKTCSAAAAKPQQGGNKPQQGGNKPAQGGNKPAQGGNKPAQGGSKPQQGGNKPAPVEGGNVTETPPHTNNTTCAEHSGNGKFKDCRAAKCAFDPATKICSDATAKPAQGGNKPAQGGNKPAQGGSKPAQGGSKPAQGGSKPAQGGNKPAQGGSKPAQGGNKPAQGGSKPTGDEPATSTAEPTTTVAPQ